MQRSISKVYVLTHLAKMGHMIRDANPLISLRCIKTTMLIQSEAFLDYAMLDKDYRAEAHADICVTEIKKSIWIK